MALMGRYMLGTAAAALLSVPLATGGAIAQSDSNQTQTGTESAAQSTGTDSGAKNDATASDTQSAQTDGSGTSGAEQDQVVATVDGEEIRRSDVMTVIGILPPEVASQPPEMLVPLATQQLILRQLILQEARSQNLAEDPDVVALVEGSTEAAQEDAMVQVWVDREMEKSVTDEAVEQIYSDLKAKSQQEVPPLEQIRPQIEQYIGQQAMQAIAAELQQDAEIVFFDATGAPMQQSQNSGGQEESGMSGEDSNTADAGSGSSDTTQKD